MKQGGFSVERRSSYKTGDKSLYKIITLQDADEPCRNEAFRDEAIGSDARAIPACLKNALAIAVRFDFPDWHDTHGYVYSHRLSY